jgi:hypothetical protein
VWEVAVCKKVKKFFDDGADSVKKGLSQIDPTTKEGLLNISTMGTYGMTKHSISQASPKEERPGETESEKAAADVAVQEHDFAREMDFVKDEYETRVERLGKKEMQNAVTGRANVDAQKQTNIMAKQVSDGLTMNGIDPSSGRAVSTMTDVQTSSGEAVGNAKSQASFALDNSHLESKNNRIAMALGEKTKAVAGLQDIAAGANKLAINKAHNKFNSNAANSEAVGTAVGMGSQAYLGREKK